jgi:uncharacterized protein YeaO (DUF488 family)
MVSRMTAVEVRRVYEVSPEASVRVLVDRIWPRGMTKARANLDEWCKEIAPSTALRTWYGHDRGLFEEFASRYKAELTEKGRAAALAHLHALASGRTLTLLTATKQVDISAAAVLAEVLQEQP